jgi:hypothetical protein
MLGKMIDGLKTPSQSMTWQQLAATTVFVLTVAIAWRQVTLYIMREI